MPRESDVDKMVAPTEAPQRPELLTLGMGKTNYPRALKIVSGHLAATVT